MAALPRGEVAPLCISERILSLFPGPPKDFGILKLCLEGFCLVITVTRLRTLDTYHIHSLKGENAICIVVL